MPDLHELCAAAVEAATGDEAVEAYAEESRHTEASALRGEIEGLTFAESRGVGVRLIAGGRLGYAYAADPSPDEVRDAVRARARERGARRARRVQRAAGVRAAAEPIAGAVPRGSGRTSRPTGKVALALDLERRAISIDPRVTKIDAAQFGDAVSRVAIASTDGRAGRVRADRRLVRGGLARRGGRRDADRVLVHDRPRHRRAGLGGDRRRGGRARGAHARRDEAADREGPDRARPVRGDVVPRRAGRGALGRGRAEAALAVRRRWSGSRSAPSCSRWSTTGRITIGPGGVAVRRRGRADRADRAVHARDAERVPAQHVHRGADRRRHASPPATRSAAATRARPASARRTSTSTPGSCRSTSCSPRPRAAC